MNKIFKLELTGSEPEVDRNNIFESDMSLMILIQWIVWNWLILYKRQFDPQHRLHLFPLQITDVPLAKTLLQMLCPLLPLIPWKYINPKKVLIINFCLQNY